MYFACEKSPMQPQPSSVVCQPAFEMCEVVMQLLLLGLESKRPVTEFETKILTTELLIRGSTKEKKRHLMN